jgi:hypothetical protein
MRFLNPAGKSRQLCVVQAMPLVHVAGAGMGKPKEPQCFRTAKPALSLQSTGIPPSGIRTVSRGEIHPASC